MQRSNRLGTPLFLLIICLLIHFFGADSGRVEHFYTGIFFKHLSATLRHFFGFFPFSLGDLLYGFVFFFLIYGIFVFIKKLIQIKGQTKSATLFSLFRLLFIWLAVVYIVFSLCWGLNYGRVGVERQLGLKLSKYDTRQLKQLNALLLEKVNHSKQSLLRNTESYPDNRRLFQSVTVAYGDLEKKYPFIRYTAPSIKSSLWGWLGNYAGFTGYYNPFTAEAQVNTTVPDFLRPFISCHEVAHQLGYAKEMEANFVGFLASTASSDTLLHYSAYLEMFLYANRELFKADSISSNHYRESLTDAVKKDILVWKQFNRNHKSFLDPLISWIYDKYLLSNRQPKGMLSYSEVVGYLVAYYRID